MKLGIIIPYRDRLDHLKQLRPKLEAYLDYRNINYYIILSEQSPGTPFNQGALHNAGYFKARELGCDYLIFHDVDMIPEDVDYSYSSTPKHLISGLNLPEGVDRVMENYYFGGAVLCPINIFEAVNGYSNDFWGWGFQDDDFRMRLEENKLLEHNYRRKGIFTTLKHSENGWVNGGFVNYNDYKSQLKIELNKSLGTNFNNDGLSTFNYTIQNVGYEGKLHHIITKLEFHKLGVCVPYRNREEHLNLFLPNIVEYLTRNFINFEIFFTHQVDQHPLNRGALKNIAAKYAFESGCDYVAFHDIDMIPKNADYSYVEVPTHLATNVKIDFDKYSYDEFFGGVVLMNKQHVLLTNGYSNEYWGWGAEDDDLKFRCKKDNLTNGNIPFRKPGEYVTLHHAEHGFNNLDYKSVLSFKNTDRLTKEVITGNINTKEEGFNSLKFKEINKHKLNNFATMIEVEL